MIALAAGAIGHERQAPQGRRDCSDPQRGAACSGSEASPQLEQQAAEQECIGSTAGQFVSAPDVHDASADAVDATQPALGIAAGAATIDIGTHQVAKGLAKAEQTREGLATGSMVFTDEELEAALHWLMPDAGIHYTV